MKQQNKKLSRFQKAEYVGDELHKNLRRLSNNQVLDTYYQEIDGKETVTIRMKNGEKLKVDVTGLLMAQIADKVIFFFRASKGRLNHEVK